MIKMMMMMVIVVVVMVMVIVMMMGMVVSDFGAAPATVWGEQHLNGPGEQ